MKRAVIIVAGGKGLRMGTEVPKQFLPLDGVPILCRTVSRFLEYDPEIAVILALPESHIGVWRTLSAPFFSSDRCIVVIGGKERYHSVKNALNNVSQDVDFTAVHDGVRPLVSVQTIARTFTGAALNGNAVPCIAPPESIRYEESGENRPLNRNCVKLIQTPQVFSTKILRQAYQIPYCEGFTDDASVVEKYGKKIFLVDGEKQNIKITTYEDLNYAEFLLKKK
ncbi:MAG: 2-C-methyl-D-erythritol 4-phosphate cytidylyltransferase [Bacteroidales bacterium]|nr:2-C-methyl-D-erythritol 4-phosphate cytidylyltransferase [Bacteroidales bacterium]